MSSSGHGGGDDHLMKAFIAYIRDEKVDKKLTSGQESLISHKMAFIADKARLEGRVCLYQDFSSLNIN